MPIDDTYPNDVLNPNPRTIANELLARRRFIPATTLNLLAASWIQFEVHDWMSHGTNVADDPWEVDLDEGDPWPVRILVGIGVAAVPALSHQYAKYAQLLVLFAGVLWGLFSLSRPKLQVVNAPYDPAHDLKLRHSEKQSELFPMREPEAGRVWLRNPSADLNSLRLR